MKSSQEIVKHFAHSDALHRGTALASNLIMLSIIATVPEFGAKGILGNAFIQFTVSGFLEIPAGRYADQFGWFSSVRIGLFLKFLTTACFASAIISITLGHPLYAWSLITLEALIDAVAVSFINGAYSTAYSRWYRQRLNDLGVDIAGAPPLFVSAFRYAAPIRFAIPLLSLSLGAFGLYFNNIARTQVFVGLLGFVFFLRILVFFRVTRDLSVVSGGDDSPEKNVKNSIFSVIRHKTSMLLLYGLSVLTSVGAGFYLYGEIFKYLGFVELSPYSLWLRGTGLGLLMHLTSVLLSRVLANRVIGIEPQRVFFFAPVALIFATTLMLLLGLTFKSFGIAALSLFLFCVFTNTFGQLLQSWITSTVLCQVPENYRATWCSVGEVFGLLMFGVISGLGFFVPFSFPTEFTYFFGVLLFSVFTFLFLLMEKPSNLDRQISIRQYLSRAIIGTTTIVLVVLACVDIYGYRVRSIGNREQGNGSIINALAAALQEPVRQGSYTEVASRLNALRLENDGVCVTVGFNDSILGECSGLSQKSTTRKLERVVYFDDKNKIPAAVVTLYSDFSDLDRQTFQQAIIIFCVYFVLGILLYFLIIQASVRILKEVEQLKFEGSGGNDQVFLIREFAVLFNELSEIGRLKKKAVSSEVLEVLAKQVSHDIRSPLSALEMISNQLSELSESKRGIIRNAVARIGDVAYSLGKREGEISETQFEVPTSIDVDFDAADNEIALIFPLLDLMASEKRIEYRQSLGLKIDLVQDEFSYGHFARIRVGDFKRAVSNLVNNAVESLPNRSGRVELKLSEASEGMVTIAISDTGKGIPKTVLGLVGTRGYTFNKDGGTGLGLAHAITTVKNLGGQLEIKSTEGQGTSVFIYLPRVDAPSWFVPKISVSPRSTIIVFDDDHSIHEIWAKRFSEATSGLNIAHFTEEREFRRFFSLTFDELDSATFLVDYEIQGSSETGLDLIEQLGISGQAILVTSHYEEPAIRSRCERLGVRLIPKSMSGFVPIEILA